MNQVTGEWEEVPKREPVFVDFWYSVEFFAIVALCILGPLLFKVLFLWR